ncbi:MAG: carbohydrate kinase family protein [Bacteroidota bacterium]
MNFLVIGHLCKDVIHLPDGTEVRSYGGIYYAVAALATLLGPSDSVVPVFGVNKTDHADIIKQLAAFPNVETSGIFKFDDPTNEVHLFYKDAQARIECSKHISKPIPFEKIRRHLSVEGILVNMISGSDITLETLDNIRMAIRSHEVPIHFDYHSLTLGINEKFERFRRPLVDWRRWAFMTDTIQLNEEEIAGLDGQNMTEEQTIKHLLTLSVKGVLVTRGEKGVTLYENDKKKVVRHDIPGEPVKRPQDATGCGDVFGAAFLMQYVKTKDMKTAAEFANRIAARKAGLTGTEQLRLLTSTTTA